MARPAPHPRRPVATVHEVSAGGVVVRAPEGGAGHDGSGEVAVIARRNRAGRLEWCLPKGHPEGEESLDQAAVREVAEETGITGVVMDRLGSIDYWFSVDGTRIHKVVHHFLLSATGGTLTIEDDPDHEAVDVAWVGLEDLESRLAFRNEQRIARQARERWTARS